MKVEIYADVVCPWCYIGERRFARAISELPDGASIDVAFRPYQLDPSASPEAIPLTQYLERRFGSLKGSAMRQVTDAAAAEGIDINWESALSVNTLHAHRLMMHVADEYDAAIQRAVAEKLFAAHFEHGLNVGDFDVLQAIAFEAGVDGDAALEYLKSERGIEEVQQSNQTANELGITAVPTFVFDGRYAVQGAQPAAVFKQVISEIALEEQHSD